LRAGLDGSGQPHVPADALPLLLLGDAMLGEQREQSLALRVGGQGWWWCAALLELLLGPEVERDPEAHGGVADGVADDLLGALAVTDADAGDAADGESDPEVAAGVEG